MTDTEPLELEDIKRLTLGPDDVLVIRVPDRMPAQSIQALGMGVKAALPHGNKVLILDAGMTLDVLTPDQVQALAPDG